MSSQVSSNERVLPAEFARLRVQLDCSNYDDGVGYSLPHVWSRSNAIPNTPHVAALIEQCLRATGRPGDIYIVGQTEVRGQNARIAFGPPPTPASRREMAAGAAAPMPALLPPVVPVGDMAARVRAAMQQGAAGAAAPVPVVPDSALALIPAQSSVLNT